MKEMKKRDRTSVENAVICNHFANFFSLVIVFFLSSKTFILFSSFNCVVGVKVSCVNRTINGHT